jgi:cytochrome c2
MDADRWTQSWRTTGAAPPRRHPGPGPRRWDRGKPSRSQSAAPPSRAWLGLMWTIGAVAGAVSFSFHTPPGVAAAEAGSAERNAAEGRQLFAQMNCFYCHRIGSRGGRLGPALDRGNWRATPPGFLRAHFRNPAAVVPGSVMPIIPMSDAEAQALIAYLASLKPGAPAPMITLPALTGNGTQSTVAEGHALYRAAACDNCHLIAGRGAAVGPALDSFGRSGSRRTRGGRDPHRRWEGFVRRSLGHRTYLAAKAQGDQSLFGKRGVLEDV